MSSAPLFPTSSPTNQPQQLPIEIRKLQALSRLKAEIVRETQLALQNLDKVNRAGIDKVWNSPLYTPNEALAVLGADAKRLIMGSSATADYLVTMHALAATPDYTRSSLPAGTNVQLNDDGTAQVI